MWHAWGRGELFTWHLWEGQKGRDHWKDQGVGGRITLRCEPLGYIKKAGYCLTS
jgi:hypothetical protein